LALNPPYGDDPEYDEQRDDDELFEHDGKPNGTPSSYKRPSGEPASLSRRS
jgi:hypothetical protein